MGPSTALASWLAGCLAGSAAIYFWAMIGRWPLDGSTQGCQNETRPARLPSWTARTAPHISSGKWGSFPRPKVALSTPRSTTPGGRAQTKMERSRSVSPLFSCTADNRASCPSPFLLFTWRRQRFLFFFVSYCKTGGVSFARLFFQSPRCQFILRSETARHFAESSALSFCPAYS
jgi:hypothetical protein